MNILVVTRTCELGLIFRLTHIYTTHTHTHTHTLIHTHTYTHIQKSINVLFSIEVLVPTNMPWTKIFIGIDLSNDDDGGDGMDGVVVV